MMIKMTTTMMITMMMTTTTTMMMMMMKKETTGDQGTYGAPSYGVRAPGNELTDFLDLVNVICLGLVKVINQQKKLWFAFQGIYYLP